MVVPETWSPDFGYGRNPKETFTKYHALIPFDSSKFIIFKPEVNTMSWIMKWF